MQFSVEDGFLCDIALSFKVLIASITQMLVFFIFKTLGIVRLLENHPTILQDLQTLKITISLI